MFFRKHIAWGILLTVIEGAVSFIQSEIWIYIALIITVFLVLAAMIAFYAYREEIALLIPDEKQKEESVLLDELNTYLTKLVSWLVRVDCNTKVSQKEVDIVWHEFDKEKALIAKCENRLSNLHGTLRPDVEQKARDLAIKRLEQYNKYVYE